MSPGSAGASRAPDEALVASMAAGDERALGVLYDAYGHVAYALAYAVAGAQAPAEAIVADAFAEAWRTAGEFDPKRTSVLAWITSLVRRKALEVRHGADRPASESALPNGGSAAGGEVGDALRALTGPQRRAIELSYFRGLTVGEIARQLGEPESGARDLLCSALLALRSRLGSSTGLRAVEDDRVVTRA